MSQLASRVDRYSVNDVQYRCSRWRQLGRGKRGGVRIIYYVRRPDAVVWLLTIYAKNERENIGSETLRKIKDEIDG
jgi:mRNA-degrading endonuclease RelE of RelBE toxin-antitoxin system